MSRKRHLFQMNQELDTLKALNKKGRIKYFAKITNDERKAWMRDLIKNNK
jgi:hypothetical protein